MNQVLLLSVKPEFADKIFNGQKTIELRKSTPKVSPGDFVVIYSTTPVKAVIGICQVKEILKLTPERMWRMHSKKLGIDKKRFTTYYKDSNLSVGIILTSIYKFTEHLPLAILKKKHPPFQPPQTFRYYNKSLFFSKSTTDFDVFLRKAS